jgi:hypothetical protein
MASAHACRFEPKRAFSSKLIPPIGLHAWRAKDMSSDPKHTGSIPG